MIKIYSWTSNATLVRRNETWLTKHGLPFEKILFSKMTVRDFEKLLSLTDNGLADLLKSTLKNKNFIKKMERTGVPLHEVISFLIKHPERLANPITVDEKRLLVGYNEEELRAFIPRNIREAHLKTMGFNVWGGTSQWAS